MFEERYETKMEEIQAKMDRHFQHEQILKGMLKYDESNTFNSDPFLLLLRECAKKNFLDEREAEFLLYILNKYEKQGMESYCLWSTKTKLKRPVREEYKMPEFVNKCENSHQLCFDYAR